MPRKSQTTTSVSAPLKSASTEPLQERILKDVFLLYNDAEHFSDRFGSRGISKIAENVNVPMLHPRKKATVMIIGNHSAGKSSFVNWYTEAECLGTGVAVESQGFTIVTSGRKDQHVTGAGVFEKYPHMSLLQKDFTEHEWEQFERHMAVVVKPSKAKDFPMVDLLDTPGLVDGEIEYPMPVNKVMCKLASQVDLIFVFLDPVGQSLCSRTMNVVAELNKSGFHDKMHYFLTKADTVRRRDDLHKVVVQVTQNLAPRLANNHGFQVPTIWIPDPDGVTGGLQLDPELNGIHKLCVTIRDTVRAKVQANLTVAQKDCEVVASKIRAALAEDQVRRAAKRKWAMWRWLCIYPMYLVLTLAMLFEAAMEFTAIVDLLPESEVRTMFHDTAHSLVTRSGPFYKVIGQLAATDMGIWQRMAVLVALFVLFMLTSAILLWRANSNSYKTRTDAEVVEMKTDITNLDKMLVYCKKMLKQFLADAQKGEYE